MQAYHPPIQVAKQAASQQLLDSGQSHACWVSAMALGVHLPQLQRKLAAVAVDRAVQLTEWRQKLQGKLRMAGRQRWQLMAGKAWREKLPGRPLMAGRVAAAAVSRGKAHEGVLMTEGVVAVVAV